MVPALQQVHRFVPLHFKLFNFISVTQVRHNVVIARKVVPSGGDP